MFQDLARYNSLLREVNERHILNQFSGLVYLPYNPNTLGSLQDKTITINVAGASLTISGSTAIRFCYFIPGYVRQNLEGSLTEQGFINTDVLYTTVNSKLYWPTDLNSRQATENPTIIHPEQIGDFIVNFPILDIFRSRVYVIDANYSVSEPEGIYKVSLLRFTGAGSVTGIKATNIVVRKGPFLEFDQSPEPPRGSDSTLSPLRRNTIIQALQMYPDRLVN